MQPTIIPISLGFVKAFLVKGDRTIVVDSGLKGSSKRIRKAMQANGIKPEDVSLLLLTHAHGDHTGGLMELRNLTGAPVAAHKANAPRPAGSGKATAAKRSWQIKLMSIFFRGQPTDTVHAEITIGDRMDLNDYGVDATVISTPGHSPDSVTLMAAGGEAIVGDMVGGGRKPALPGIYEDLAAMKASIAGLAAYSITRVHTCHGGVYEIGDVLKLASQGKHSESQEVHTKT